MYTGTRPIDFEDPADDDVFGRGKIEDFTWKGLLDFATCTECGRCQSQCPAWNTGKPLSPKLVMMDLRDHLLAKAPYIIGGKEAPEGGSIELAHEEQGHAVYYFENTEGGHGSGAVNKQTAQVTALQYAYLWMMLP
jgi:Fe-S oxidoreductase